MSRTFLTALPVFSLMAAFGTALLCGQPQAPTAFEVASIKEHPSRSGASHKPWLPTFQCDPKVHCGITGNRFREVSVSLADLIVDAYKVKRFQVFGLPGWGDSGHDEYDVEAKAPDGFTPTADQARSMLQVLLADRFQLSIHHESRLLPVDVLLVSKKG